MKKLLCFNLVFLLFTINNYAQIITTVAGFGIPGFAGDNGLATNAELNNPDGIVIDIFGNLYISDHYNFRIRKVDTFGIITTFAGTGVSGYNGDFIPATNAKITQGCYLYFNTIDNNLYIADALNRRIRKIGINDTITTFAGTGVIGFSGDNGQATAAKLGTPTGVTFDKYGNLYYADDSYCRIRKIDTNGIITTVAGNGGIGLSGDNGPADSAALNHPVDVTVDKKGNIYFTELDNNRIRKVDTNGIITTYAGTGVFGYSGDNGPATDATLFYPEGITVDGLGNVFFADEENNVIRKIDTNGIISTIAGNGFLAGTASGGFSGDNGPATDAELNNPTGVAFDKYGNLYIADWLNNRIRKVTNIGIMYPVEVTPPSPSPNEREKLMQNVRVFPNPAGKWVCIEGGLGCTGSILDMLGQAVQTFSFTKNIETINISSLATGVYIVEVLNKDGEKRRVKMVKE